MIVEGKNANVIRDSSTRNYTENADFIEVCKEAVRLNAGMEQIVEYVKSCRNMKIANIYNYIRKAQKGNNAAREKVVRAYMPHALRKAVYYSKLFDATDMLEDIYQEFVIGIHEGIMQFDFNSKSEISMLLNVRLQRVLTNTIISNGDRKYNIPIHVAMDLFRVINYLSKYGYTKDDKNVIMDYCKNEMKCDEDKAMMFYTMLQEPETLDNVDVSYDMGEVCDRKIDKEILKKQIEECLKTLSDKQVFVVKHRFGLNGLEKLTLEKIGKELGVTRERVRQIESAAFGKICAYCRKVGCEIEACCAA